MMTDLEHKWRLSSLVKELNEALVDARGGGLRVTLLGVVPGWEATENVEALLEPVIMRVV